MLGFKLFVLLTDLINPGVEDNHTDDPYGIFEPDVHQINLEGINIS
jgi:hypothetical protein